MTRARAITMAPAIGMVLVAGSAGVGLFAAIQGAMTLGLSTGVLLGIFAGGVLLLSPRLEKLTVKGVGSMRARVEKAVNDADEIDRLRRRVEAQAETVAAIARDASATRDVARETQELARRAESALDGVRTDAAKASAIVKSLQAQQEVLQIKVKADAGQAAAYRLIYERAQDPGPTQSMYVEALQAIMDSWESPMETVYGSPMSSDTNLDSIRRQFPDLSPNHQTAVAQQVPSLTQLSDSQKLRLLLEIYENCAHIETMAAAGKRLNGAIPAETPGKTNFKRLAYSELRDLARSAIDRSSSSVGSMEG